LNQYLIAVFLSTLWGVSCPIVGHGAPFFTSKEHTMSELNTPSNTPKVFKKKRQFAPVWLGGLLTIISRNGKNGEFRVAKLETGIGEFAVKDKVLEQYEPGVYKGQFLIGLIQAKPSFWKNSVFVEVRAYLDELIIDTHDQLDEDATKSVESANTGPAMDPLELERSEAPKSATVDVKPLLAATAHTPAAAPANEEELLTALGFVRELDVQEGRLGKDDKGDQIAAVLSRQPVALDAKALDREALRKQRDHLKGIGYRFISTGQYWAIADTE
jgi:Protein of unknown function (DUF3275)